MVVGSGQVVARSMSGKVELSKSKSFRMTQVASLVVKDRQIQDKMLAAMSPQERAKLLESMSDAERADVMSLMSAKDKVHCCVMNCCQLGLCDEMTVCVRDDSYQLLSLSGYWLKSV